MKTSKMIDEITIGQRVWSANLGCVVRYDELRGLLIERSDKPDLVGLKLDMNHFVIITDDWMFLPDALTDFNEIFANIKTNDGVTLITPSNVVYNICKYNMFTVLDCISANKVIDGKWFNGMIKEESLKKWGYIK